MKRSLATALLNVTLVAFGAAQTPTQVDLVRCAASSDAPCLRSREVVGANRATFGAGSEGIGGLGRAAWRHVDTIRDAGGAVAVTVTSWRPPLMALPAFRGVADSAALSPERREALLIGTSAGSDRPVIALLVALIVAFGWMFVVHLGRREPEPAPSREGSNTTRTGAAVEESPPRSPDEVTKQTARRTALGR